MGYFFHFGTVQERINHEIRERDRKKHWCSNEALFLRTSERKQKGHKTYRDCESDEEKGEMKARRTHIRKSLLHTAQGAPYKHVQDNVILFHAKLQMVHWRTTTTACEHAQPQHSNQSARRLVHERGRTVSTALLATPAARSLVERNTCAIAAEKLLRRVIQLRSLIFAMSGAATCLMYSNFPVQIHVCVVVIG